jgi:hypothetical protein
MKNMIVGLPVFMAALLSAGPAFAAGSGGLIVTAGAPAQKVAYVCRPIANAQNGPFPELLCSALDVSAAPGVRKTIATTRTAPLSVGAAVPGLTTQQQDASIQKSFEDTFMPDGSNGD